MLLYYYVFDMLNTDGQPPLPHVSLQALHKTRSQRLMSRESVQWRYCTVAWQVWHYSTMLNGHHTSIEVSVT